jgi:hypothetical protein
MKTNLVNALESIKSADDLAPAEQMGTLFIALCRELVHTASLVAGSLSPQPSTISGCCRV